MSWLRRLLGASRPAGAGTGREVVGRSPGRSADRDGPAADEPFACTTCGRDDLPEAGGWDPPICQECDAAINFDAIEEQEDFDDR